MENPSRSAATFSTQADALLRKNLTFQKRNTKSNVCLVLIPFLLCSLLITLQTLINTQLDKPENKCGCKCVGKDNGNGMCEEVCGIEYSSLSQGRFCPIRNPQPWPALLQIPAEMNRAVRVDFGLGNDFASESCREDGSCPVTMLFTGNNQSLGESLGQNMFPRFRSALNGSNSISDYVLGSDTDTESRNILEPAFFSNRPVYIIQQHCNPGSSFSVPIEAYSATAQQEIRCARPLILWRNGSSEINNALYKGYWKGNPTRVVNEIATAYDFSNSDGRNINLTVWYNSTFAEFTNNRPAKMVRVPKSVNLVSNMFLQYLKGPGTKMLIDFVKEMPKHGTQLRLDISSLIGTLFFIWVILLLFPASSFTEHS